MWPAGMPQLQQLHLLVELVHWRSGLIVKAQEAPTSDALEREVVCPLEATGVVLARPSFRRACNIAARLVHCRCHSTAIPLSPTLSTIVPLSCWICLATHASRGCRERAMKIRTPPLGKKIERCRRTALLSALENFEGAVRCVGLRCQPAFAVPTLWFQMLMLIVPLCSQTATLGTY